VRPCEDGKIKARRILQLERVTVDRLLPDSRPRLFYSIFSSLYHS
jgi:hypothetical protein